MNHKTHLYITVGLLAVGAALFFSGGVSGSALFLLWPLACVLMIVAMMWGMRGTSEGPPEHTHDDGTTHSHDTPARTNRERL